MAGNVLLHGMMAGNVLLHGIVTGNVLLGGCVAAGGSRRVDWRAAARGRRTNGTRTSRDRWLWRSVFQVEGGRRCDARTTQMSRALCSCPPATSCLLEHTRAAPLTEVVAVRACRLVRFVGAGGRVLQVLILLASLQIHLTCVFANSS